MAYLLRVSLIKNYDQASSRKKRFTDLIIEQTQNYLFSFDIEMQINESVGSYIYKIPVSDKITKKLSRQILFLRLSRIRIPICCLGLSVTGTTQVRKLFFLKIIRKPLMGFISALINTPAVFFQCL